MAITRLGLYGGSRAALVVASAGALVGASSITFGSTATLTGNGALSGSSSLTFSPTSTLTGNGALSGSSSLTFTSAENLTSSSDDATDALWLKSAATIDSDVAVAADGRTTMDRLNVAATTAEHRIAQLQVGALGESTHTLYADVINDGAGFVTLALAETGERFFSVTFDLSDGSVTQNDVGTTSGEVKNTTAENLGGGIYRLSATGICGSDGADTLFSYVAASNAGTFTGNLVGVNSYTAVEGDDLIIGNMRCFAPMSTLTGTGDLSGSSILTFTASSTLSGTGALSGTAPLAFTVSATLTGTGALSASSSVVFTASGTLANASSGAMSGTSTLTFTGTGSLTGDGALSGSSSLTFTNSGILIGKGLLSGSSSITFAADGTLENGASTSLSGSSSLTFTGSGTLTGDGELSGSSSLTFTASGTLTDLAGINVFVQSVSITGRFDIDTTITGRFDMDLPITSKVA